MADDDKWGQNIDKIAYGAAGVIGLIVLAIPFLLGGPIRDGECAAEVEALEDRIEGQPQAVREALAKGEGEPPLREILVKQWTVGPPAPHDPSWVTELQPVLIRRIPQKPQEVPVHAAGEITEVACDRDAEKKVPFLVVKGAVGQGNQHVVIRRAVLLRKEGEGAFAAVPGFRGVTARGTFEFKDYAVEAGKTYSYQLRTTAARDSKAPEDVKQLDPKEAEKTSEPLGPTPPVPHDFYIAITTIESPDLTNPNAVARFFGRLKYWDYKAAKEVDWKGGSPVYFAEKEKFADDRFEFFQVLFDELKVVVRDLENGVKHEILQKESRDPRDVTCWPALTPAAAAPADGDGAPPPEEEPPPAKAKARAPAAAKAAAPKPKEKASAKPKASSGDDKKKRKFR